MGDETKETSIGEKSVLSVHLVVMIVLLAIWLARLGFKVEAQDEKISVLERVCGVDSYTMPKAKFPKHRGLLEPEGE